MQQVKSTAYAYTFLRLPEIHAEILVTWSFKNFFFSPVLFCRFTDFPLIVRSRLESLDKAPSSEEECNEMKECLLTICTSSDSSARSYLEEVLRRLQEGNSPSTQARKKMKGSTTPKVRNRR